MVWCAALLTVAPLPAQAALLAQWDFEEGGGATTADTGVAPANTGTLVGAQFSTFSKRGAWSMRFNAANRNYVSVPNEASLNPTVALTIAAWVFADGLNPITGNARVLQKGATDNQYRLKYEGGWLHFDFNTAAGPRRAEVIMPSEGVWHHFVGTYDGETARLYVDGVEVQAVTYFDPSPLVTTTDSLIIGNKEVNGGDGWQGYLDDVRVYDVALSAAQVSTLFRFTGGVAVYEKLFDLAQSRGGETPRARLLLARDGNFYGTTQLGGVNFDGTIFRMTPAGDVTTLVEFSSLAGVQESAPEALTEGSDGNFYGATRGNDITSSGTLFRMTPGGVLTTLVTLTGTSGANKGSGPNGPLVQGADGNFYGTTERGGADNAGTVFRLSPAGVFTTLAEFSGPNGSRPLAGLVRGLDGNFYGTTANGGTNGFGAIFRITPGGALTTLYSLSPASGSTPRAPLVQSSDGILYGTTAADGAHGHGTLFRISFGGIFDHLLSFDETNGSTPKAGLIEAGDGNLYGTTSLGGANGLGTVFRVTSAGALTTLVSFTGGSGDSKGAIPLVDLIQGADGKLYGTTSEGGSRAKGTVFKMTTAGALTTLVEFPTGDDANAGSLALGTLVQGDDDTFHGTTAGGGANGNGTVFQMKLTEGIATSVNFDGTNGSLPFAGMVKGNDGNFYGSTVLGGASSNGTVFKMTPAGVLTTLVNFDDSNGGQPEGNLAPGNDGNFYGTTKIGGANGSGTVFRMTPAGALTTLVSFTGANGSTPRAGLVRGSDGNFYGTTAGLSNQGSVFRITPAGVLTPLVQFTGNGASNKGGTPRAALVEGVDGNFYGTTEVGGASNFGTVFKMTPAGTLTTLVQFTGNAATNKGRYPIGGLVEGGDGNFYGTTERGGANDAGTVFKMTHGGVLTTIAEFVSGADGLPRASLIVGADDNLYGVTAGSAGTVFRLAFPGAPQFGPAVLSNAGTGEMGIAVNVNPRGNATAVTLEFGPVGNFNQIFPVAVGVSGFGPRIVGATLSGLLPAAIYQYRFTATNNAGATVSPVQTFAAPAPPDVVTLPASEVAPTSARFNGTVNARSFDTSVVFEWGTDGNSFPNTMPAVPGTVTGNVVVPVSAAVAGLPEGGTVFYRIRAANNAGTVISGARSFSTLSVTTSNPLPAEIGVTTVTFRATINTFGQTAAVKFKYWVNSAPAVIFETATQTVTSNGPIEVSTRVTGLLENVAYSYRVSVELAGTETDGGAVMFTTDTNQAPVAADDLVFYSGQVVVDPLANDTDANGDALLLDPVLVMPPNASLGVASVTNDRRFISYNPQFNVRDDDALTYRVVDPLGASAEAQVRLIAFSKRAGLYGGRIAFGTGTAQEREGQIAVQMGSGGAISTSFMAWPSEGDGVRESFVLKGVFDQRGRVTRTLNSPTGAVLTLTLRLDADAPQMFGTFEERVNDISTTGEIAFVLTKNAGTGGLAESGLRTGFLSPPPAQAGVMADGFLRMTVGRDARRGARFAGRLPDGEPFLAGARAEGRTYTLVRKLEQGGVFTGLVRAIDTSAGAGGMMGDLFWQKRASNRARFHRSGVATMLSLAGVAYPQVARGELPPLGLGATSPNARLRISGGDLSGTYRDLLLNVLPGGVTIIGPDPNQLPEPPGSELQTIDATRMKLKVDGAQAKFTGRFLHPQTQRLVPFEGALRAPFDSQPAQGRGVFRGPTAAGAVRIEANP